MLGRVKFHVFKGAWDRRDGQALVKRFDTVAIRVVSVDLEGVRNASSRWVLESFDLKYDSWSSCNVLIKAIFDLNSTWRRPSDFAFSLYILFAKELKLLNARISDLLW
jgi:hypothetical protein